MYGILLIVVVISLSGLIAYLGDQIGMKVGKRRVSLFGLRPKYSSVIITILTGVLIATLTITVILATNNGVRQALFRIQYVLGRLDNLESQLTTVSSNLSQKEQELSGLQQELSGLQQELNDLKQDKENLQKQKETLIRQKKSLEQQKQELENKLVVLQQDLNQSREEIKTLQSNKDKLEMQLEDLENTVAELNTVRKKLETRVNELNDELARIQQELDVASKTNLNFLTKQFVFQRGDIIYLDVIKVDQSEEKIVEDVRSFLERANEEVLKYPVKVDEEQGMAIKLPEIEDIYTATAAILQSDQEKMIVSLVADANVLKNSWVFSRLLVMEDFIVFEQGELIISKEINAENSPEEIQKVLRDLLTDLNVKSVKQGLLTDQQGYVGTIDFSQFYELLNQIKNKQGSVIVKIFASQDVWREDGWNNNFTGKLDFKITAAGEG